MSIAEAVASATQYLTDHPDEARYRDSAAVARLVEGLRVQVRGADGSNLQTDLPTGIGGTATAPSPGWLFRAAIASCVASLIAIRAAVLEWELESVEVEVDGESDDRGILGMADDIPAGPLSTRIAVGMSVRGGGHDVKALVQWAVDHCPVSDGLKRAVPVELTIRPGSEPVRRP
ncbi:MAG TPA: OsmC family protein [Candidatus Limnocylindria bacterium]|nr:OsmC family protein [Candidatus Limnocylindria bacterium]